MPKAVDSIDRMPQSWKGSNTQREHNVGANPVTYWEKLLFNPSPPWPTECWKNDEGVTVRIRQGDAVLSGHEDLSNMTQCDLRSWILVNYQVNWLDAGPIQVLQMRQDGFTKHAGTIPNSSNSDAQQEREMCESRERKDPLHDTQLTASAFIFFSLLV